MTWPMIWSTFVNFSIIRSILVQFSQVWSFLSTLVHSMHFFHSIHFGLFGLFLSNSIWSTSFQFGPFPYSLVQIDFFSPLKSIRSPFNPARSISIYYIYCYLLRPTLVHLIHLIHLVHLLKNGKIHILD